MSFTNAPLVGSLLGEEYSCLYLPGLAGVEWEDGAIFSASDHWGLLLVASVALMLPMALSALALCAYVGAILGVTGAPGFGVGAVVAGLAGLLATPFIAACSIRAALRVRGKLVARANGTREQQTPHSG